MRLKTLVRCSASVAMLAASIAPAWAQDEVADDAAAQPPDAASEDPSQDTGTAGEEDSIVVTGLRRSLQSAQNIKRDSPRILDAIVAEDIGKLPDIAVSETAARIPGVQVTRRAGEADTVLVRGLPDFSTTYNGREIFTAERREVALQDFPSANIAALEVYKTTTAELVEAGLAGQVNVRSRRPFDFSEGQIAGSVWMLRTQQAGEWNPNANLLFTDRWDLGGGEFGVLVNASYTEIDYLDSEISNTDFIAGGPAGSRFPDIQRLFYRAGNRVRPSANVALQYRPSPGLEIYAEGLYQGFRNKISDRLWTQPLWGGSSYTNLVFRDGTDLLSSGTVTSPFRADGFQGGTFNKTDTYQAAVGGRFETGALTVTADLARTHSRFRGSTASVDYRVVRGYTINWDNETPEFEFENFDESNPANYIFNGFYEEAQVSEGDDWQFRVDADYDTGNDVLTLVEAGVRYTDRDAHREFGNRFAGFDERYAGGPIPISAVPLDYRLFRSGFRGTDVQSGFNTWLAPTYRSIRDNLEEMRQFVISRGPPDPRSFGVFTTDPPVPNPASVYDANEKTLAGYLQAHFQFGEVVDGLVGLRAVRTQTSLNGTALVAGVPTPINSESEFTDWLPNISARIHIAPRLQLRLSATQTRTRPTFDQLNPSVSVGSPSGVCTPGGDPFACARRGSGGNPNLRPFTSDNFDASLEYFFSSVGFIAGAVFWRDLDGFIQNQELRFIDPVLGPLIISGPVNTGSGRINGVEVQFSTFFDWQWVPQILRGFGVQANATWLDHEVDDPISATIRERRIYGVSNFTYNLVAMYESGPVTARLSWNDFSGRLETIQNRGNDIYIERSDPGGRLDLSTSFDVNDNFTVFFDWTNILGDPFRQDLSSARDGAPRAEYIRFLRYEETTLSGGIRFRF